MRQNDSLDDYSDNPGKYWYNIEVIDEEHTKRWQQLQIQMDLHVISQ
jgi:hypothetical protein